jgi:monomeric sarcosine oxidase
MPSSAFDVIVLGVGGVGSAALDQLAQRGSFALGLDRFPPGHDRGSSHGRTRLTRQAYYEHPDYVPLLKRAYELWADLSARARKNLYHEVGVLCAGRPDRPVISGVLASARQHNLEVEQLSATDVAARFPGFRSREPLAALFERRAGYLDCEDAVRAAADQAVKNDAFLQTDANVIEWKPEGTGVTVRTDRTTYHAGSLIIAAGAWSGPLLADLGIRFDVLRKSFYWYEAPEIYAASHGAPGFIYETEAGNFYGFPDINQQGLKVGEHTGGLPVADALIVDRSEDADETARIDRFLSVHLPEVTRRQLHFATCLYTLSPDRNFVVDRHPEYPQVSFAAGLSGHGFKFVPVLGEALADLAERGKTNLPIEFLSCRRESLKAGPSQPG